MTDGCQIRRADWNFDRAALQDVRRQVFIVEQGIPEELEWDVDDPRSLHVLALSADGQPIGTGRLLPDGHIGRMAVLEGWRRRGVASAILRTLLAWAREAGHAVARLHAQSYVVEFYQAHGFRVEGDEFLEVGIAHRYMLCRLDP